MTDQFNEQDFGGKVFSEDTPEGRPPRTWDFFLTIFLLFLLLVLTVIFVVLGLGFGVATLTCADSNIECNYDFISFGALLVIIGVPIVALVGIIISVVWIARRKLSFLVALIACVVAVGVFALGSTIVDLAVPGT
ncbi:hypothetical protein BH10ACT7_BH10ACT7_07510 [soil metagenome]